MKELIILGVKGFIMGIANVIPGVSGGTLAIILGIYEKLISAISHFFKNIKENLKFIIPIGIGMVLSILLLSKVISFCLDKYTLATILFFIGLILGGIPLLSKKVKGKVNISNAIIFLLTFSLVIGVALLNVEGNVSFDNMTFGSYLLLFGVGVVAAGTMIIPGISGSLVLLTLGYYNPIVDTIKNLTDFSNLFNNMLILVPFGIGVLVGIIVIAKILEFLFKKFEIKTYFGVMGFVCASLVAIFISTEGLVFSVPQLLMGIILLLIGFLIAYKLGE